MPKQATSLRNWVVGVIAAAALVLPISVAQADQRTDATVPLKKHAARMHHPKQRKSEIRPGIYGAAANSSGRCTWPYRNQFPPCQSTWPAGDPNYHGSRPGVTFDEPWDPNQ
jgi:hypothetical protein